MKHLLVRTGIQTYRYVIRKMESKLTPSSVINLNTYNYLDLKEKLSHRPMFTKYYLVKITYEEDAKYLDWVCNELLTLDWIQGVVFTNTMETFEQLQKKLQKLEPVIFDCYNVDKNFMLRYITRQLFELSDGRIRLTKSKADLIRRRIRYQEVQLDSKLQILANTNCTIKIIERTIPRYRGVKLATLPYHFFSGSKQGEVAGFIGRYMHSSEYVYDPIHEFANTWLELYEHYLSGELAPTNYLDWMLANGEKYKIKFPYQMERWMGLLRSHGYERVLTIKLELDAHAKDNDFGRIFTLYKLLKGMSL